MGDGNGRKRPEGDEEQLLVRHLRRVASGNEHAHADVGAIYELYAPRFIGLLRSHGTSQEDAQEIVHDCFVSVIEHAKTVVQAQSPKAYLYRMLLNAQASFHRRRQSARSVSIDELAEAAGDAGVNDDGLLDCVQRVFTMLERQNPERALVIRAVVVEELDRRELAEMLGRSYAATRQFLYETRKQFMQLLTRNCRDYLPEKGAQ